MELGEFRLSGSAAFGMDFFYPKNLRSDRIRKIYLRSDVDLTIFDKAYNIDVEVSQLSTETWRYYLTHTTPTRSVVSDNLVLVPPLHAYYTIEKEGGEKTLSKGSISGKLRLNV